ncbi:MAG TPA: cadherin domain-containing protein [Planctomycetaceae bacterium]|nr:cadherin domain-containing protein [Planctomycetaceae bacterium]
MITQPPSSIAANSSASFQIRFAPTTAGLQQASVSFSTNDLDENPYTFSLRGFAYENVDLVISNISFTPPSNVGGMVDVTWTVTNQGSGNYQGTFADSLAISADALIGGDISLGSFPSTVVLNAGQSVTRTQRLTLPGSLAGSTYLVVRADSGGDVLELNEANNVAIDNQPLVIPAADLQVFDVQAAPVVETGQTTQVTWKVRNVSTADTLPGASWVDRVFLSTDTVLDANDVALGTQILNPQALAVGESYASLATVTIPYGTYGVRYLLVNTDRNAAVIELNETNNTGAGNLTNVSWQPPDLRVTQLASQFLAFAGTTTRVSWEVTNVGQTAMRASESIWLDRVWLSADSILDPNDRSLGTFQHTGLLQPGTSYTQNIDVALPPASSLPAGNYFVIVETDSARQVLEGPFETNNASADSTTVQVVHTPPPDLIVESVGSPPLNAFAGQEIDVTFSVKNVGAGATEPSNTVWFDRVFLSVDGVLDGNDRLLSTIRHNGGLNSGAGYSLTRDVDLPSDLTGTFRLLVATNALRDVFGDNPTNNTASSVGTVTIAPAPADLDVTKVTLSALTTVANAPLIVNFEVKNIGPRATQAATWKDRVFLSQDTQLDAGDLIFGDAVRTGVLAADASYQASVTGSIPQLGTYYVIVQSDLDNAVTEVFKANNRMTAYERIQVVAAPADLTATELTIPAAGRPGAEITVSYRVTNTGPNATLANAWTDRLYLSTDNILDENDRLVKTQPHFGALAAGAFYDATTALAIPDDAAGQFYVLLHTDAADAVFEVDQVDNIRTSTAPVNLVTQPIDLVPQSVNAPVTALAGGTVRIDWKEKNQAIGDTVVSSWKSRVFLATENLFNPQTARLLGEFAYTHRNATGTAVPLPGGASANRSELVVLPADVTGNLFFFVMTDSRDVVPESVETNNVSAPRAVTVSRSNVDLQVTGATTAVSVTEAQPFDVSWTVKNFGTASTTANFWYDDIYLSTDAVLSPDDVRIASVRRTNPLSAGQEYAVTASVVAPIGVTQGSPKPFFVLVKTDGGDTPTVVESSETNNVRATVGTVMMTPATSGPVANLQAVSVQAPPTGQAGQPLTVGWTVTNNTAVALPARRWFDAVYLSLDRQLDRETDVYLGFVQQNRALAPGESYTPSATFSLPSDLVGDYYVIVVADSGKALPETQELDNVATSAAVVSVQSAPPADLVIGTISVPVSAVIGQSATITYTVQNIGANPARGRWSDALYISTDEAWDVNDAFFGRVLHIGDLLPSASYTESLTAKLPALPPGNYHVIVRSDIRNNIVEGNEQNNVRGSLNEVTLSVPVLTPGVAVDLDLAQGDSAYYQITVPANQTLSLSLDSLSATGETQIFVSKGVLPSPSSFEFASTKPTFADQLLLVPDTEAATYYVRVSRITTPGSEPRATLLANLTPFSVISTDVWRVGNSGSVTMAITGTQFRDLRQIVLDGGVNGIVRPATRFTVADSTLAFATFDLSGLTLGDYSLRLTNSAAQTVALTNAVKVEAALSGAAKLSLSMPDRVRAGLTFQATLTVYNDGNTDVAAPLVQFDSESTMLLGYRADDLEDMTLTAVVVPPDGFGDVLRPGQSVQIVVHAKEKTGVPGAPASLRARSIGESERPIALTPIITDAEIEEQFGPEAEYVNLLMDSFTNGTEADIVRSLVASGAGDLSSSLGYADAMAARRTQLAMVSYLSEFVDLHTLISSLDEPEARFRVADAVNQARFIPSRKSGADFVVHGAPGTSGNVKYIVPGFVASETPPEWATKMADQLKRICPADTVVIVTWNSGSLLDLSANILSEFAIGALPGLLTGNKIRAVLGGLRSAVQVVDDYYENAALKTPDLGRAIFAHASANAGSLAQVTIYGHSLGAQAAGFAGAASDGQIGQIVGFDPAGPLFNFGPAYRLDPKDAKNVQTINTSGTLGRYCDSGTEGNNYYPEPDEWRTFFGNHSYAHEYYLKHLEDVGGGDCKPPTLDPKDEGSKECAEDEFDDVNPFDREDKDDVDIVASVDPNDILGPNGFGPEHWIAATQPLDYTIRFENDPVFASAPAREIRITQTLDSDLDLSTFRLGNFGLGDLVVDVPDNRSFYSTRLDLRSTKGIYVDVFAGLNAATREVFWQFYAIDPLTGDLPSDPDKGLLPPNVNPPEGDGFVRYSVRAKTNVATGTRIDAQARIVFDVNEPIDTPPIFHTLDAVAPTSVVLPVQAEQVDDRGRFTVRWQGTDDAGGSAIRDYDIYVKIDDGTFEPWLTGVTFTEAVYDGPVGQTYAFYSVARDNAGLSEPAPLVSDVVSNRPPVVSAAVFSVTENSPNQTTIGTVQASDPNAGQTVTFAITGGNTNNAFRIDPNTGVLSVNNSAALDFEARPQFQLTVAATDNGTPRRVGTATVTVNLQNINEAPVVVPKQFLIGENSVNNAFIGKVLATDPEAGQTLTYAITAGNVNNAFAIDAVTGTLSVNNSAALNYESVQQFDLTVQARDSANPSLAGTATVTVFLRDVNEFNPVVGAKQFLINENSVNGAFIGTIPSTDNDTLQTRRYSITGGNVNDAFAINETTGVLSVKNSAAVNFEVTPRFDLTVTAIDSGNPARSGSATVTVFLRDVNDAPVVTPKQFLINENSQNNAFIGTIPATDADAGQSLTFAISAGNIGDAFAIHPLTGTLTVKNSAALNFESLQQFNLTVTVTDSNNPARSTSAPVTVFLRDVNEFTPVVSPQTLSLVENSPAGSVVGTVTAADADTRQSRTFAIAAGNFNDAFRIDPVTGVIAINNPAAINFEVTPQFDLTITATDNGNPARVGSAVIRIQLTNVNESPVVTPRDFSIPENSQNNAVIGTIAAVDPDFGQQRTFAITAGNTNNAFAIDPQTGTLTVRNSAALNYETVTVFQLTVTVTDNGTPVKSGTALVRVFLRDVNEAPTVIPRDFLIGENSAIGAFIGTLTATDPDPGQTRQFAITAGNLNNAFSINPTTGALSVNSSSALNFETTPQFNLTITVTDDGNPAKSGNALVRVFLRDVNEAPVLTPVSVSLPENSPNGTLVTQLNGVDPDGGQTVRYALLSGNTSNAFALDAVTGRITVANSAALDFENQPPFVLSVSVTDNGSPVQTITVPVRITLSNVNDPPLVYDATVTIPENRPAGTVVLDYRTIASDRDAGQTLGFAITGGNTGNAFAIHPTTGIITVNNAVAIDFETTPTFELTITVTDNGTPPRSSSAKLTIRLTNLNDPPTVVPATFTLSENRPAGTLVGTVAATDIESGQTRTFAITGGNINNAFAINPQTGELTVQNATALDFDTRPTFALTVSATDNGTPSATGSAVITVNLQNLNETPQVMPQTFAVRTRAAAGTNVGTVVAQDQDLGQSLTYTIVSGNGVFNNVFRINSATGQLTVNNALGILSDGQFTLAVRVADNGTPSLSTTVNITIYVNSTGTVPRVLPKALGYQAAVIRGNAPLRVIQPRVAVSTWKRA